MASTKAQPKLALKLALQELRHGWRHFTVFISCLVLGVAIMGSVGGLGGVVEYALKSQAKSLLGGDIEARIRGVEATEEQRRFLEQYGKLSYVATLRTMLYNEDNALLVEIKAVDNAYPLVGDLRLHDRFLREEALRGRGIVVDPILLSQLAIAVGDRVQIGEAEYTIRGTLAKEPDRAVQMFSFGPRVMMSHEALQASGLAGMMSLVEHRYRIVTPPGVVADEAYEAKIEAALEERFPEVKWRVRTGNDGNRTVQRFTDQLLAFLMLSGLATFLIAGIGIGSSARRYLEKKLPTMAVFKTLGATRRTVLWIYIWVLGLLGIVGGLIGVVMAFAAVQALLPLLSQVLPVLETVRYISPFPFLVAMWYGILIVFIFSMPALLSALDVRPSLLFRSKSQVLLFRSDDHTKIVVGYITILLIVTLVLTAHDPDLILGAIAVMGMAFAVFAYFATLVRYIAKRIQVKRPWLKLALGNLYRPGSSAGTVIFAIGISLTVLIALTVTEANFQSRIDRLVKEEAPSLFMIDIQPHQVEPLEALLLEYAADEKIMLYPMIRGRISHLNGVSVSEAEVDDDVRWAVRGDRGVSYSATLPENAQIILGEWWPEEYDGEPLVSVDKRFIDGMNLKIGSTITLNILGEEVTARVASARDIDYSTFQINFAMMLSPGVLEAFPQTYLATVHLDSSTEKEADLVRRIAMELPGVTLIRTKEIVELVKEAVGYIATALSVTVAISLFAGLLVLVSALSATIEQRMYDIAVFKVLGARQRDILKSCTAEWMLLALFTSVIAAVIGTLSAWLINLYFRNDDFAAMPEVTITTILACIVVIWLTGYIGNRRLFRLRPAGLLRNE